jgi:hypothetical protein
VSWDEYIAEFDTCGCDGGFATVAWQDFRSTDLICGYRYKGGIFEGLKQGDSGVAKIQDFWPPLGGLDTLGALQ